MTHSTVHYTTGQHTTLYYTDHIAVQLQLQLHFTTPHAAVASDVTAAPTPKSTARTTSWILLVHQWICFAIHASQQRTSSRVLEFLSFKLLPPPCAVLLVWCHMRFNFELVSSVWKIRSCTSILHLPRPDRQDFRFWFSVMAKAQGFSAALSQPFQMFAQIDEAERWNRALTEVHGTNSEPRKGHIST